MVLGDINIYDVRWAVDDTDSFFVQTGLASHRSQYFRDAAKFLNEMLELPLYQLSNVQNKASNVLDLLFVKFFADLRMSVDRSMVIEQCHHAIMCHTKFYSSIHSGQSIITIK